MSVLLNTSQAFTELGSIVLTPLYGNWQWRSNFNTSTPNIVFMKNQPQSPVMFYELKPMQSYHVWSNAGYTNMKLTKEVTYPTDFQSASGLLFNEPLNNDIDYSLSSGNTWYNMTMYISPNLSNTNGLHYINVKFKIVGTKHGIQHVLSAYDFPIYIHVLDEGFYFSPLEFTFFKSNNVTPSQALIVGGEDWTLNVPNGLKITSTTAVITTLPNGGYSSSGTGTTTFALQFDTNISSVVGSNPTMVLPVLVSYPNINYTIPVNIIQTGDIYPMSLQYYVASGLVSDEYIDIMINKSGDVDFVVPDFLEANFYEVENERFLRVAVVAPENLGSGVYNGTIELNVGPSAFQIPVTVSVSMAFDIGIENETINFTNTMEDVKFISNNTNTFAEVVLKASTYADELLYRIPYVNGKCQKSLGSVLSRLIQFTDEALDNSYSLPYFNLNIKEKFQGSVLLEFNKTNIPVMRGYKPSILHNKAILQHNVISRFNPSSFALVSLLSLNGLYRYSIRKNGVDVFTSENLFGYIVTKKIYFSDYECVAGDVLDFILHVNETEEIKKSFVIFPDSETSFDIVYEDSFGLKSVLNFTGTSILKEKELNNVLETYRTKNFFHKRKLTISHDDTIRLNTGFILNSQILEVEELLNSNNATLYKNGQKITTLIPLTEKMTNKDTDRFLIEYSVEFHINTESYAQGNHI